MSLGRRLFNVARAELKDAARKLAGSEAPGYESEPEPLEFEPRSAVASDHHAPPEVRRYYANLELPPGASLTEVKAAYRRLMRRYHPDLHQQDPERALAATKLAQELRTAYDGLLLYLGGP